MDFYSENAPEGLTKEFVDTSHWLPNLRRFELLNANQRSPVAVGLGRKSATLPNICEMVIGSAYRVIELLRRRTEACPGIDPFTHSHRPDKFNVIQSCTKLKEISDRTCRKLQVRPLQ